MNIKLILNRSQTVPVNIFFLVALITAGNTKVNAEMGDSLWVTGTVVNMREGPSLNEPVLLKLIRGTRVVEISRFEEWVEVTIDRGDVEVGWIHASLLAKGDASALDEGDIYGHYQKFMTEFEKFRNARMLEDGITHFSDISSDGEAALQLTATDEWFNLPLERREEILYGIFRLWKESSESGTRVSVEVVDKNKQAHMMIFR